MMQTDSNKILIITAPSGAGKTSITRYLMNRFPDKLAFSISAATRQPRGQEKDGVDYFFMSETDFRKKIDEDAFVEWEMVYAGKYYGTLKSELERIWSEGRVPLLDIDVKGAVNVQKQYPGQTLSMFIEPPSLEELRRRLESRGTETPASLSDRLNKANYELGFKENFNFVIINDLLPRACSEAEEILIRFLN
jgi:guanylate kinase